MILSLIGYRGTGKTSVARELARGLGWDWVDADVEIELRAGKSIAGIFAAGGEPAFRDLESAVLAELTQREKTVLACGGGAILRAENRQALRSAGKVVWLQASPETIVERVAADSSTAGRRPQLTTAGGLAEVQHLLAERTPFYAQCADLAIDTEQLSPAEVAAEIAHKLQAAP